MKIGELAKQSGLTAHTLRYYEKLGLIEPLKSQQNNYRDYSDDDLHTAHFIKRCKDSGFSLDDTAALLSIKDAKSEHVCAEAKAITEAKITDIQSKIKKLQQLEQTLSLLAKKCCGGPESAEFCSIIAKLEDQDKGGSHVAT